MAVCSRSWQWPPPHDRRAWSPFAPHPDDRWSAGRNCRDRSRCACPHSTNPPHPDEEENGLFERRNDSSDSASEGKRQGTAALQTLRSSNGDTKSLASWSAVILYRFCQRYSLQTLKIPPKAASSSRSNRPLNLPGP